MYRRFLFISMLSLFLLMIFSGCKKSAIEEATEPEPVVSLSEEFMFDNTVYTKSLDELARLVAFGMKDKEFRIFIKQQAEKQIDGDYDVIYEFTKDKAVKGKSTLEDYLHHISGVYFGKSGKLDKLISNVKDFQISVPVNCESWDVENYEPLVTYIPASFDEKTFKYVKAYDSEGNVYALPLDRAPERPVIVLGSCERMDIVKNIAPGDGGGSGGSYPSYKKGIFLEKLKFTDLGYYESWIAGKPEIEAYIFNQNTNMAIGSFVDKPYRDQVDNVWKYYHFHLANIASFDKCYYIQFIEKDYTLPISAILDVTKVFIAIITNLKDSSNNSIPVSLKLTLPFKQGVDDDMGTYRVLHTDPNPALYGNGKFYFYISRKY